MANNIVLGNRVVDKISSFEGIATSRIEYIDGRTEIGVTPQSVSNESPKVQWISEAYLDVVDGGVNVEQTKQEPVGFGKI